MSEEMKVLKFKNHFFMNVCVLIDTFDAFISLVFTCTRFRVHNCYGIS